MKPQTSRLILAKLKHEIGGEPFAIARDRLVQVTGRNAVELGQMGIEHHLLAADQKYSPLNLNRQRAGTLSVAPLTRDC